MYKSEKWNVGYVWADKDAKDRNSVLAIVGENLAEALPHGSGIDYEWSVSIDAQSGKGLTIFNFGNSFHRMDEMGGYHDVVDFGVKVTFRGDVKTWEMTIPECDGLPFFDYDGFQEAMSTYEMNPTWNEEPTDEDFMLISDPEEEKQILKDSNVDSFDIAITGFDFFRALCEALREVFLSENL